MNVRPIVIATMLAMLLSSCGEDNPLRRVTFHVRYAGVERDGSMPLTVHTATGWDVTLTAAQVSIGPIYLRNDASPGMDLDQGRAVAQVLTEFTVDALNPSWTALSAGGNGVTEPARAAEVRFAEADVGPIADAAGPSVAVAHIAGTAQRGPETITFDGTLVLPPLTSGATAYRAVVAHRVVHIPVDLTVGQDGFLGLRVDPTHWLDHVEFDALGPSPTASVRDLSGTSATTQLLAGIGNPTNVFLFTWSATE